MARWECEVGMGKFIEKHKVKIFVLLLIIGFLIVDDAYHKWKRSNEPYLKDTLAPYKGVEVYDIN